MSSIDIFTGTKEFIQGSSDRIDLDLVTKYFTIDEFGSLLKLLQVQPEIFLSESKIFDDNVEYISPEGLRFKAMQVNCINYLSNSPYIYFPNDLSKNGSKTDWSNWAHDIQKNVGYGYPSVSSKKPIYVENIGSFDDGDGERVFPPYPDYMSQIQMFTQYFLGQLLEIAKGQNRLPIVLDPGSGSGIQSMLWARYGHENNMRLKVVAADINPKSAVATENNFRINGFSDYLSQVLSGDLADTLAGVDKIDFTFCNFPYQPTAQAFDSRSGKFFEIPLSNQGTALHANAGPLGDSVYIKLLPKILNKLNSYGIAVINSNLPFGNNGNRLMYNFFSGSLDGVNPRDFIVLKIPQFGDLSTGKPFAVDSYSFLQSVYGGLAEEYAREVSTLFPFRTHDIIVFIKKSEGGNRNILPELYNLPPALTMAGGHEKDFAKAHWSIATRSREYLAIWKIVNQMPESNRKKYLRRMLYNSA